MVVGEKPVGEQFIGALGGSFLSGAVVNMFRKIVNDKVSAVRPGQLLTAIQNNTSIWSLAGADIIQMANQLPKPLVTAGRPMYQKAVKEYGSATELALVWLKEDNPSLFSLIINTDGGIAWFDRQVKELTAKVGLDYE